MTPLIIEPEQCLGCGFEVEAMAYYRRGDDRIGYIDSCGAMVIDGVIVGFSPGS